MKILIVGASGMIGGEALIQCLAHPAVSSVTAFVRRDLPAELSSHSKLTSIIIKDFSTWPEDVLRAHADADAMIWAMGSYNGSETADLEYPAAFVDSMAPVLESKGDRAPFRFVLLSGKFVRQNQEEKLWFLDRPRKLKGRMETKALKFAEDHPAIWQSFVIKPGGVVPKTFLAGGATGVVTGLASVFGENWSVRLDELGAFMTYLAIDGNGEDPLIENGRIARKGKEILASQEGGAKL